MEQQLNIFSMQKDNEKKSIKRINEEWFIYIDGASRGNPGPSGSGIKILKGKEPISKHYLFLGKKTNNQAEYLSLVLALLYLKKISQKIDDKISKVNIISDSELLIKQMNGEYKVKNESLSIMYQFIKALLDGLNYKFIHVTRDKNTEADALANKAIDTKHKIPDSLLKILSQQGIEI